MHCKACFDGYYLEDDKCYENTDDEEEEDKVSVVSCSNMIIIFYSPFIIYDYFIYVSFCPFINSNSFLNTIFP